MALLGLSKGVPFAPQQFWDACGQTTYYNISLNRKICGMPRLNKLRLRLSSTHPSPPPILAPLPSVIVIPPVTGVMGRNMYALYHDGRMNRFPKVGVGMSAWSETEVGGLDLFDIWSGVPESSRPERCPPSDVSNTPHLGSGPAEDEQLFAMVIEHNDDHVSSREPVKAWCCRFE